MVICGIKPRARKQNLQQFHTILIASLFLKTKADETTINQKSNHYAQQSVQIS